MTENLAGRGEGLAGAIACVKEFIAWATEQIGTSEAHGCAEQAEDALKLLEAAAPPSTGFVVSGEPLTEAEDRWLKASAAALATPPPQPLPRKCFNCEQQEGLQDVPLCKECFTELEDVR